jgi:hypothetical protein
MNVEDIVADWERVRRRKAERGWIDPPETTDAMRNKGVDVT